MTVLVPWKHYQLIDFEVFRWQKSETTFFFHKHKVHKHTEAQISKKLSIF